MTDTAIMSIRIPLSLKEQLENIARITKRSRSFWAVEAIQNYLERETWLFEEIKKGIDDLDNGRTVSHEKIKKMVEGWDD